MALFGKLFGRFRADQSVSNADWDELSATLIEADFGPVLAARLISLAKSSRERGSDPELALRAELSSALAAQDSARALSIGAILVVGVNGTGKTTSTAKLAKFIKAEGHSVILAAADTFRAAATEQLQTWGARLQIEVVAGKQGGDPSAVAFDASAKAAAAGTDCLLVDTAGRLHTKTGLMDELGKLRRVIEKHRAITEVLLVIDATTGQNGITQAKVFAESVKVTGLILTKLDGSAKGGIAIAIEQELGIPIKFVGTGEGVDDFAAFETQSFLNGLFA
jgi:fused signal recognition particle receptor